jgi:hypothetical protein
MLHSTSLPTSFSKLENNPSPNDENRDLPALIPHPPQISQREVGEARNEWHTEGTFPAQQEIKYKDLSEGIVRPQPPKLPKEKVHVLRARQRWEGTITEVNGDEFTAVLADLSNPGNSEEEAVLSLNELVVQDDDIPLIKPGSSFYWIVGTETTPAGVRKNVSFLEFKRIPRWSTNAVSRAKARADRFEKLFARSK